MFTEVIDLFNRTVGIGTVKLRALSSLLLFSSLIIGCDRELPQGQSYSDKVLSGIVNGTEVGSDDPISRSTVALYRYATPGPSKVDPFCSAVLIGRYHVLTAAHCVPTKDRPNTIVVGFGTKVVHQIESGPTAFRTIQNITVHPAYTPNFLARIDEEPAYDIALLKLAEEAPSLFTSAPLAQTNLLEEDTILTLAGFGLIDGQKFIRASHLMKTSVTVENPKFSKTQFTYRVTDRHSACSGDSGGPAYWVSPKGEITLVGITSWGDSSCTTMGAYTSVFAMLKWIEQAQTGLL